MAAADAPKLDASLAALERAGVAGAAEARRLSLGQADAARALAAVNPRRKSRALDALVRLAAQPGLRRRGAIELLLEVHGGDPVGVAGRARRAYVATARGAAVEDALTAPTHAWTALAAAAAAAAGGSLAYVRARARVDGGAYPEYGHAFVAGYGHAFGAEPLDAAEPRHVLDAPLMAALRWALLALAATALLSAASIARAALAARARAAGRGASAAALAG